MDFHGMTLLHARGDKKAPKRILTPPFWYLSGFDRGLESLESVSDLLDFTPDQFDVFGRQVGTI
jgi:hypothetical protein